MIVRRHHKRVLDIPSAQLLGYHRHRVVAKDQRHRTQVPRNLFLLLVQKRDEPMAPKSCCQHHYPSAIHGRSRHQSAPEVGKHIRLLILEHYFLLLGGWEIRHHYIDELVSCVDDIVDILCHGIDKNRLLWPNRIVGPDCPRAQLTQIMNKYIQRVVVVQLLCAVDVVQELATILAI